MTPERRHLPATRHSLTHKLVIFAEKERFKGFLTVGLYPDGRPGEIFLTMDHADTGLRGMAHAWSIAVSLLLQHGIALEEIVAQFQHQRFEPSGWTKEPNIHFAQSIVDYVARWLTINFLATNNNTKGETNMHEITHYKLAPDGRLMACCKGGPNVVIQTGALNPEQKRILANLKKAPKEEAPAEEASDQAQETSDKPAPAEEASDQAQETSDKPAPAEEAPDKKGKRKK